MELVGLVGARHAAHEPAQPVEDPPVDLVESRRRLAIARRVEVGEVAQEEPERVADPAVRVGEAVEDLAGDPDILGVVLGRYPQAKDLGAVLRQEVVEADDVAEGLRHLSSVAVDEEPVRDDALIGWRAARADRLEERGLEPPAVLVRALDVHLRRPPELGPRLEDGRVAAPRVEPDVEDVGLLREPVAAALGAARAWRSEEHTSELQSRLHLVCRLLLEKKKNS